MLSRQPRILVIDDDPELRRLVVALLEREDFSVAEAGDGTAALKVLAEREFDLLVTDVRLPPPFDGIETVRAARFRWPWLRSLFISGVREPVLDDPRRDDFITKPFDSRELLGCVWELLTRDVAEHEVPSYRKGALLAILEGRIAMLTHQQEAAHRAGDTVQETELRAQLVDAAGMRDWLEDWREPVAG